MWLANGLPSGLVGMDGDVDADEVAASGTTVVQSPTMSCSSSREHSCLHRLSSTNCKIALSQIKIN